MSSVVTQPSTVDGAFAAEWQRWHEQHEKRRADRHGFLAITSLHWLDNFPQVFLDAPGRWSTGESGPVVVLDDDQELVIDGTPVRGRHRFGVIGERDSTFVEWGDAVLEVAKRGGYDILRPRHPDNPLLVAYTGTPAYPARNEWRTTGHYEAFDRPRPTTVGAAVEGLQHVYDAPGVITFSLAGRDLALTAFPASSGRGLMVLFTDETSGVTTYAANRVLAIEPPASDGTVLLDFNRAVNLPCAYTELATCPLPPVENRLPIAVEAGEKMPPQDA